MSQLTLTRRQINEIRMAMIYEKYLGHGTDGHHRLLLLAIIAKHIGFRMDDSATLFTPESIAILDGGNDEPRTSS